MCFVAERDLVFNVTIRIVPSRSMFDALVARALLITKRKRKCLKTTNFLFSAQTTKNKAVKSLELKASKA